MPPLNKLLKRFKIHLKIGVAGRYQINNIVTSLASNCSPPKKKKKKETTNFSRLQRYNLLRGLLRMDKPV